MLKILFVDDVYFKEIGKQRYLDLKEKTDLLPLKDKVSIKYQNSIEKPEIEEYDIVFLHNSYENPLIASNTINDWLLHFEGKLFTFSGGGAGNINRELLYNNFLTFLEYYLHLNIINPKVASQKFDGIFMDLRRIATSESGKKWQSKVLQSPILAFLFEKANFNEEQVKLEHKEIQELLAPPQFFNYLRKLNSKLT